MVAIGRGRDYTQAVAAGLALHPELLTGARIEGDVAGREGALEGFGVDEAEHEDVAVVGVLDDGGTRPCIFSKSIFIVTSGLKSLSYSLLNRRPKGLRHPTTEKTKSPLILVSGLWILFYFAFR